MAVGYSGKSLAQKLGIKEETQLFVINDPGKDYHAALGFKPVKFNKQKEPQIIHFFTLSKAELATTLKKLRSLIHRDGMVWVSWPKKSARVKTDVTEDVIREVAYPLDFVDLKVCAVTEIWSGLKLMIRKEKR